MANVFNPSGASANPTAGQVATQLQYGGDPREAMINAILNMGGNPFSSSPMMKMLLSLAPGLQATEFLSNIGAKPTDIQGMGGQGKMFGDFLQNAIGGGGNIFSTLSNTFSQLPQYMNQLRDYQNQVKSGGIAGGQISPFAASLEDQLSSPSGMGNLMTSLIAPSLGSLGRPYAGALQDVLGAQNNRMLNEFGQSGNLANPPNFFDYVFGRG
jgi:hypothetical protein